MGTGCSTSTLGASAGVCSAVFSVLGACAGCVCVTTGAGAL